VSFLDDVVRMLPTLGFAVLAAVVLVSAWMVGRARRITHAAFFMVLAFTGVAGVFVLLGADFLAGSQVLVYVGAIAIMFLFAIMVSDLKELSDSGEDARRGAAGAGTPDGEEGPSTRPSPHARTRGLWLGLAGLVAVGFGGLVLAALHRADLPSGTIAAAAGPPTTAPIGHELFTTFLVPFEVASVVLLVALVGAIVLSAREDEPSAGPDGPRQEGGDAA